MGVKFSLFLVNGGQVLVGMDNHKPKGAHLHLGEQELPYLYRDEKGLGKAKPRRDEELISIASWEILAKVLSPPRLQILTAIPQLKPKSIAHLARELKKDFKNVYSDVRFLANLGLIELREEGTRKILVPIARFSGIELPLAA